MFNLKIKFPPVEMKMNRRRSDMIGTDIIDDWTKWLELGFEPEISEDMFLQHLLAGKP